jgi:restriction system protein
MRRIWVIAPADSTKKEAWEKTWEYDLNNNVIAIGWGEMGDVSSFNENQLKQKIDITFPECKTGTKTLFFNSVWNFLHNIQIDDIVIARRGTKRIAAIGKVTGTAFYNLEKAWLRMPYREKNPYPYFISVEWMDDKKDIVFDKIVFSMVTIYEINEEKYQSLFNGSGESSDKTKVEEIDHDIVNKTEFIMEKYLEEFIISNFDKIFPKNLKLIEDEDGNVLNQYPTDVGIIDILAQDTKTKAYIIIELKKGKESDKVVGQTLRYMGWIKENLAIDGEEVKGIIICKEADTKLKYAVSMIKDISIKYYEIDFRIRD